MEHEVAAFVLSLMRGITRVITEKAWQKSPVSRREFGRPPLNLELSLGTRILLYHDDRHITRAGASARLNNTELYTTGSPTASSRVSSSC